MPLLRARYVVIEFTKGFIMLKPDLFIDHSDKRRSFSHMSTTAEKIVAALSLPPQASAFVAERLIESLDAGSGEALSRAWREELLKRCREMDESTVELRDAADVFAKAYAALT